jgi:hypothetical protein
MREWLTDAEVLAGRKKAAGRRVPRDVTCPTCGLEMKAQALAKHRKGCGPRVNGPLVCAGCGVEVGGVSELMVHYEETGCGAEVGAWLEGMKARRRGGVGTAA